MISIDAIEKCAKGRVSTQYICAQGPGERGREMPTWGDLLELVTAYRDARTELEALRGKVLYAGEQIGEITTRVGRIMGIVENAAREKTKESGGQG